MDEFCSRGSETRVGFGHFSALKGDFLQWGDQLWALLVFPPCVHTGAFPKVEDIQGHQAVQKSCACDGEGRVGASLTGVAG